MMIPRSIKTIQKIVQSVTSSTDLADALNKLVQAIHSTLNVDVCSIYLNNKTAENYLLMASHGLNPDAVGRVTLAYDEGLVGLVGERSEPVNIANAPRHPRFRYFPEIGEESYRSFLGIPIIQQGDLVAVLVVQRKSARRFNDKDIAFLATLAALIAGNIVIAKARGQIKELKANKKESGGVYQGFAGSPGLCIGTGVLIYTSSDLNSIPDRKPENFSRETRIFRKAVNDVVRELHMISEQLSGKLPEADRKLFEAYAMIASDEEFVNATIKRIRSGNWAQGALRDTIQWYAAQFEAMEDAYLSERANDIRDIGRRILAKLQRVVQKQRNYPDKIILVGENLSPLDLGLVPPGSLTGVVSGRGSGYSHLAILAHALNIPAVMGFSEQLPLSQLDGKTLVVDGYHGSIHVSPNKSDSREYLSLLKGEQKLAKHLDSLRDKPAITQDGLRIHLYTNSGLLTGFTHAFDVGTEGIGLFRTELPFMDKESFPSELEQYNLYRQVLAAYAPRPVTLRTLDIGGDKPLAYFPVNEPNPFLGWRGIRVSLDHPEIFLTQVRAMLRASGGLNNLKILLPMISNVDEVDRAVSMIHRARNELLEDGLTVFMPEIGVMIEVPSTIFQIPVIAKRVDFLSLGSNDLMQYLLAIDRNNARVAKLFDPLHPSILGAIKQIAKAAKKSRIPLCICGEAAGDPAIVMLLIALEIDSLSLSAGDLPRIKWVIRTISYQRSKELWEKVKKMEHTADIRRLLNNELEQQGLGGLLGPVKSQ